MADKIVIAPVIRMSLEKGLERRLKLLQKEINSSLETAYKNTYGPDKKLSDIYSSRSVQSALFRQRTTGKARTGLRELYREAWMNTYQKITESYEQSDSWQARKTKMKNSGGVAAYGLREADIKRVSKSRQRLGLYNKRNPKYRVRYSSTGLFTGFLRRSIAEGFLRGGNEFIEVSGDNTVAGYQINLDKFPVNGEEEGDESYAINWVRYLINNTSYSSPEEIFRFTDEDQDRIAAYMVRIAENQFIPEFTSLLSDLADKVNK